MKRIFSLLVLLTLPMMLFVNTASAIPPNSYAVGQDWKCNTGYKRQGQQCNKIFIPPNAVLRGQDWICKTGFKRVGQQCNRQAKKSIRVQLTPSKPALPRRSLRTLNQLERALKSYGKEDYKNALKLLDPLANQGDSTSQYYLGRMYDFGYGVLTDKQRAVTWYRKAAIQGDMAAQLELGHMYSNGIGGLRNNDREAVEWYRKAAIQGSASAQFRLGGAYKFGRGVLRDEKKAMEWFRKAAIQDYSIAQYFLGSGYCQGTGVAEDLRQCAYWIKKAYKNGDKGASKIWDEYELWKYQ